MNTMATVLVVIGSLFIIISLFNARHPPTSGRFMGIHKSMDNERITKQLDKGPRRAVAGLGIASGILIIVAGLVWQLLSSWMLMG